MLGLTKHLKQLRGLAVRDAIDAAATPGKIAVYGTARPATGGAAGGDPLVVFVLDQPCGTVSASGVLTITPPEDMVQITGAGSPVWARFLDGDDTPLFDATAGISNAEVIVDQEVFYPGAFTALLSCALTEGG